MLSTASNARFGDLVLASYMFLVAVVGPTRVMLEDGAPTKILRALRATGFALFGGISSESGGSERICSLTGIPALLAYSFITTNDTDHWLVHGRVSRRAHQW